MRVPPRGSFSPPRGSVGYADGMSDAERRDAERRARAEARRTRGVTVERMTSLDETSAPYADATIEERLTAMTRLCRAAWLATGRSMPLEGREHRASQPGEVYWPDHAS